MSDDRGHPNSNSPEYKAWEAMKSRCYRKGDHSYARYGGRGITVCDKWRNSFPAFYADLGARPSKTHSLDRIDVNGNYEPGNVRWGTIAEQQNNRSSTVKVTYRGREMSFKEAWQLANSGVSYVHAITRYRDDGWTVERAVETAPGGATVAPVSSDAATGRPALFPMQGGGPNIPWTLAEAIFEAYERNYGSSQSIEKLAARGGFTWHEVDICFQQLPQRTRLQICEKANAVLLAEATGRADLVKALEEAKGIADYEHERANKLVAERDIALGSRSGLEQALHAVSDECAGTIALEDSAAVTAALAPVKNIADGALARLASIKNNGGGQ